MEQAWKVKKGLSEEFVGEEENRKKMKGVGKVDKEKKGHRKRQTQKSGNMGRKNKA